MPAACTRPVGHDVRYIPLSYNHADSQASALRLVLTVNPHWKEAQGKITFVRFTDGITNTLLKITLRAPGLSEEAIDKEAVLMRAYGNNSEILIDREREARSHALLASRGLAPPLLARFANGLLYRFVRGQVASADDLTVPAVWRGVARRLGQWHAALPVSETACLDRDGDSVSLGSSDSDLKSDLKMAQESVVEVDDITPIATRLDAPNLWATLQKWILALPKGSEQERDRRRGLQREYERIVGEFDNGSGLGEDGMVFAHCDLLSANVIILPQPKSSETVEVDFIDYEYSTPSPAAFDLANHFAEWAGYDCDYTRLPTRSVRRGFLAEYVESYSQHAALPGRKDEVVDQLFADVDRYRGLPGFYWGVWALIQATISRIDFDYASYAEERLGEYWAWRREQDGSRLRDGGEIPGRERRWAE